MSFHLEQSHSAEKMNEDPVASPDRIKYLFEQYLNGESGIWILALVIQKWISVELDVGIVDALKHARQKKRTSL